MKLNNKGWGYQMMTLLMSILIGFLLLASYYIYNYYDKMIENIHQSDYIIKGVKWKRHQYY